MENYNPLKFKTKEEFVEFLIKNYLNLGISKLKNLTILGPVGFAKTYCDDIKYQTKVGPVELDYATAFFKYKNLSITIIENEQFTNILVIPGLIEEEN
ncbi:MAG: hypothetical protein IKR19_08550 [Acholeplasmatales bacterium]|nr:hypothetical protein [Acholeplasmatales bacterium]